MAHHISHFSSWRSLTLAGVGVSLGLCFEALARGNWTRALEEGGMAQPRVSFVCEKYGSQPVTVAHHSGRQVPIIHWDSTYLGESEISADERCKMASGHLQEAYDSGNFVYLTVDKVDGEFVACFARVNQGPCLGVLFPLTSDEWPNVSLSNLLRLSNRIEGPIDETDPPIYLNLLEYLNQR